MLIWELPPSWCLRNIWKTPNEFQIFWKIDEIFLQTFYKNGFWYKMMNFQILLNPITETDLVHFAKQMAILKVIFFCLPTYYI